MLHCVTFQRDQPYSCLSALASHLWLVRGYVVIVEGVWTRAIGKAHYMELSMTFTIRIDMGHVLLLCILRIVESIGDALVKV
jgi:hypothetical protein